VGDSLGMPFEKLGDEVHPDLATWTGEYQPGTWHELPPGHYTDDTEMAECLATSLIACHGFDGADVARRYLAWSQGTPHGMGGTTRIAMEGLATGVSWRHSGVSFDDPNKVGSAPPMRAAPIGAHYQNKASIFNACQQDAYITHAHPEGIAASFAVAMTVCLMLQDVETLATLPRVLEALHRAKLAGPLTCVENGLYLAHRALRNHATPEFFAKEYAGRRGNAWQITTTAIYCALHAKTFREGVIEAVKLGGDADTRGAITGAILGARFGLEGIPDEYKTGLHRLDDLARLDRELLDGVQT
jgi:ADP-ribosyl-[dinitrogen reductase] hydrolase